MSMALFIAVGSVESQRLVDSAGELLKPWQRAEEVGAARQGYLKSPYLLVLPPGY